MRRRAKPCTLNPKRQLKNPSFAIGQEIYPPIEQDYDYPRPKKFGQCDDSQNCPSCGKQLTPQDALKFECGNCGTFLLKIRPCPFTGCPYNTYLDVNERTGSIKINQPDIPPWKVDPNVSCVLDIYPSQGSGRRPKSQATISTDGWTLEEIGRLIRTTRERTRQIELKSMKKIREAHPELYELIR